MEGMAKRRQAPPECLQANTTTTKHWEGAARVTHQSGRSQQPQCSRCTTPDSGDTPLQSGRLPALRQQATKLGI